MIRHYLMVYKYDWHNFDGTKWFPFSSWYYHITTTNETNNEVEKIQIPKTPLFKYGESFCNTLISILILLFRFVYQVNRMYRFGTEVRLFCDYNKTIKLWREQFMVNLHPTVQDCCQQKKAKRQRVLNLRVFKRAQPTGSRGSFYFCFLAILNARSVTGYN